MDFEELKRRTRKISFEEYLRAGFMIGLFLFIVWVIFSMVKKTNTIGANDSASNTY